MPPFRHFVACSSQGGGLDFHLYGDGPIKDYFLTQVQNFFHPMIAISGKIDEIIISSHIVIHIVIHIILIHKNFILEHTDEVDL